MYLRNLDSACHGVRLEDGPAPATGRGDVSSPFLGRGDRVFDNPWLGSGA